MGLVTGKLQVQNQINSANELNLEEIEFLLSIIKDAHFKGEQIETVYNTIIKLQNKYIEQTKK